LKRLIQLNVIFFSLLCLHPAAIATAETKSKPPKPKAERFHVTVDGKEIGVATLRVSQSKTGRYAAWRLKTTDKDHTPQWSLHQKKIDGALVKYQRLEDKRLGAGVIAFSKGNIVRIVGKNQKRAPIEIETAYHALWDPKTWLSIWDWPTRLGKAGDSVRMAIYNVQTGAKGAVEGTRSTVSVYKLKDTTVLEAVKWTLTGLGPRPLTVYMTQAGKLLYLTDGARSMLRVGLSLTPPPPVEEPPTETEPGSVVEPPSEKPETKPATPGN
jgi:hypothetical protein